MTKKYKMNKYVALLTAIVLLFTCVSSIKAFASSDNANNPRPKEDAIKSKISEYFNARNAMLADLVFDSSIENYFTDSENLAIVALETDIEHRKMQITDLKYVDYQCDLDYIEISTWGNTAKVSVTETNKIHFKCSPDVDSEESYLHEMNMKKLNGDWLIDSDEHNRDSYQALKNYQAETKTRSAKTPQIIKSEILDQSKADSDLRKKEYAQTKADYENGIVRERNVTYGTPNAVTPMAASSSQQYCLSLYNREAAKNYAHKYYNNPNAFGFNIESSGGNCTNFTSQCLRAGGIKDDRTGSYQWYFTNANNRAPAWTSANDFRNYYRNNVGSASTFGLMAGQCSFSETYLGDLTQFLTNGVATHTMIITDCLSEAASDFWEYKYDVMITQNSINAYGREIDMPFSTKIRQHKGEQYEYIKIIGCWG